jgi:outer membrane receptor protein involved in Fe transport
MKQIRLAILAIVLTMTVSAWAQLSTATLFGTVTDNTGAVIPNATITLTQVDTNFTRTVKANEQGQYRAEFLPIGSYTAKVEAGGFQPMVQSGIALTATQHADLNFTLSVGMESTVVQVTSEVPLVNLGNSTLSRTVDSIEVDNLPLVGRNAYRLLDLTPGVQSNTFENTVGFPAQHVIINGSPDDLVGEVSYYLDGGLNMTGLRNTGNALPNPDTIQEFVVQTNNFSAEYGRTGAGIVTVVTKSGTNQVHGSVFEFHRETNFDATSHGQSSKTPLHVNNFGATLGGPVIKNKTFLFGSYGGLRQVNPVNFNTVVPDALQRVGNFSENLPTTTPVSGLGACATALNAADRANTNYGGKFFVCNPVTHQPIAGNRADLNANYKALLDPVAAAVLSQNVPLPSGGRTDNRFIGNMGLPNSTNEFLIKGDQQLGQSHRLTLDYFQSNGSQLLLPSNSTLGTWAISNYAYRQQTANASDVWTHGSAVNQIWLSYTRMNAGRSSQPAKSLADYGSELNVQGPPQLPQISVAGFFSLNNQISGPVAGTNVYGLRDVYTTTHGDHTLFFGGEGYLEKDVQQTLLNDYGVFAYTNTTVPNTASAQAAYLKTGVAMADFLIGRPNSFSQDSPDNANANYWNWGLFAEDDWRITRRLTLNLGLRYDIQTAPTDTQRRYSIFKPGVQSTVSPTAILGQLFPGDPGVPVGGVDTNYNHVSPRVGFAFDPFGNGKTVFHGAAGLFFGTISGNMWELPQNFQPFAVRFTNAFTHVTSMKNLYSSDPADFPNPTNPASPIGVSPFPYFYSKSNPRYVAPSALTFLQQGFRWPYNDQFNVGVQQQLAKDLALSINYVGVLNRKLPFIIDENAPVFNTVAPANNTTNNFNCRRPYLAEPFGAGTACPGTLVPGRNYMAGASVIQSGQNLNYNGLQVTVEKRLSHSVSVIGFYVWSKSLGTASLQTTGNIGNSAGTMPEDYYNIGLEKQRADNDRTHVSTTSVVWKPDYYKGDNRFARFGLNGWTVSTIVTFQSGLPLAIITGTDDNRDGTVNDRPNLTTGRIPATGIAPKSAAPYQWFNPAGFCTSGTAGCLGTGPGNLDGTLRVNTLNGPGMRNVDASIFRDITIYERTKLQIRADAVNVFNIFNPDKPGLTLSSAATAGIITNGLPQGNAGGARVIQIGGRVLW